MEPDQARRLARFHLDVALALYRAREQADLSIEALAERAGLEPERVLMIGEGEAAALRLAEANIITNKNLIPSDRPEDWNHPGGLRIGTTEVTRWGMREPEMTRLAGLIADALHQRRDADAVKRDAVELRRSFPILQLCFPESG